MRNFASFLFIFFFSVQAVTAQLSTTTITLNKIPQQAFKLDLPVDDDVTEDFFVSNLKKTGYSTDSKSKIFAKGNKIDEGYYAVKGVKLQGTSDPVDIYIKTEQKGKKGNHESTIYMLVSKEGGFITSSSDRTTYNAAENFLNAFINQAFAYKFQKAIEEQEDELKDAEKKLERQQKDEKDLEKRIENLQKDLKDNKEDQKKQEKTIEDEKQKLEELKKEAKKYS